MAAVQGLEDAGLGTLDALLQAEPADLEAVDGVGAKTAEAILEWARGFGTATPAAAKPDTPADETEQVEASPEGGDDFMAALSRALKEAEEDATPGDEADGDTEKES